VPAAVEFVNRHQRDGDRDVFGGVAVQAHHARHLRIAAVAERNAQFDPVDGDVDAERHKYERQESGVERGDCNRH